MNRAELVKARWMPLPGVPSPPKVPRLKILGDLELMDRFNRVWRTANSSLSTVTRLRRRVQRAASSGGDRGCGVHVCGRPYHVENASGKAEEHQARAVPTAAWAGKMSMMSPSPAPTMIAAANSDASRKPRLSPDISLCRIRSAAASAGRCACARAMRCLQIAGHA